MKYYLLSVVSILVFFGLIFIFSDLGLAIFGLYLSPFIFYFSFKLFKKGLEKDKVDYTSKEGFSQFIKIILIIMVSFLLITQITNFIIEKL